MLVRHRRESGASIGVWGGDVSGPGGSVCRGRGTAAWWFRAFISGGVSGHRRRGDQIVELASAIRVD